MRFARPLVVSLVWLPTLVLGLRGSQLQKKKSIEEDEPRKQEEDLLLEDAEPFERTLKEIRNEGADCVEYDTVPSFIIDHPLTSQFCGSFESCSGCCRTYSWLFCDPHNAFPEIPCVCENSWLNSAQGDEDADEDDTDGKEPLQVLLPTPTMPPTAAETNVSFILAVGGDNAVVSSNATNSTSNNATDIVSMGNEGYFTIDLVENSNITTMNATNATNLTDSSTLATTTTTSAPSSAATTIPASAAPIPTPLPAGAISPDACSAGSAMVDTLGFDSFFECKTSLDCANLVPVGRSGIADENGVAARKKNREDDEEEEDEEDFTDSLEGDGSEQLILNAEAAPVQTFCCLASMCLCGVPLGDWTGKCVPPYLDPASATTDAPLVAVTDAPSNVVATEPPSNHPSLRPSAMPSALAPVTPDPTTSEPTAEPTTLPPVPATLPPVPATLPPVPATLPPVVPATLPPVPATLPPIPATLPPVLGTQVPASNVSSIPTSNVSSTAAPVPLPAATVSPTFLQVAEPATTLPPVSVEASLEAPHAPTQAPTPQPTATTACSDGSWYHDDPNFSNDELYRPCVSSSDCDDTKNECCLLDFCFCGRVPSGDKSMCV